MKLLKNLIFGLFALTLFMGKMFSSSKKIKSQNNKSNPEKENDNAESDEEPPAPVVLIRQADGEQKAKAATSHSGKQAKQTQRRKWKYAKLQTYFTGIIASFTIANVVTTALQWQTMDKSLQVTQQAYVVVSDVKANFESGEITVYLENIGRAPAKDVNLGVKVRRGERGMTEPYKFEPIHNARIFPHGIKNFVVIRLDNFTQEEARLITTGKEAFILTCIIDYENGFGSKETTEADVKYSPPPNERWETFYEWRRRV